MLISLWIYQTISFFQLLDVREVKIESISIKTSAGLAPVTFYITDDVKDIGSKLTIELPTKTSGK
jgi:hypothetical protein